MHRHFSPWHDLLPTVHAHDPQGRLVVRAHKSAQPPAVAQAHRVGHIVGIDFPAAQCRERKGVGCGREKCASPGRGFDNDAGAFAEPQQQIAHFPGEILRRLKVAKFNFAR